MTNAEIEKAFSYHKPNEAQAAAYVTLRADAKAFAVAIDELCPDGQEKSIAFTKLREAVMWANAAIAVGG